MDYLQYEFQILFVLLKRVVLNLIINGLPSIWKSINLRKIEGLVLNLIINGLPSILLSGVQSECKNETVLVLNLIINGLPSIYL